MDLELIRTFLEVINTGSFVAAASRLNVTQSTISTRIRLLEEQVGVALFVRNRNGAALTPAGVQFQRSASAIVGIWEQARQDAALPHGFNESLRIGGEPGLWQRWLHRWVVWMRHHAPTIALRCEAGIREGMTEALLEGVLDIAVMFSPQLRPTLKAELLTEDELVLLEAGAPGPAGTRGEPIFVNWGEEFRRMHRLRFPDAPNPGLTFDMGTIGFDYLLRVGGSGYFPKELAAPHLASGRVRVVPGSERFLIPVYAVYPADTASRAVAPALDGLRAILRQQQHETPAADAGEPAGVPAGNPA